MKIAVKTACLLLLLSPSLTLAQTTPPAPAAPPPGCTSPESHQFDFWVGKWEVFPASSPTTKIADSLIEKLYLGCAVRENWMPLATRAQGGGGGSLNAYNPTTGKWRQTWLDPGGFADFTGGWDGTKMSIEGFWPQPGAPANQITRMTYTPLPDGSVEQAGFTSDDNGATWQPSFDLIYRHPAA